jgi:DNA-directed RNA polymerase specialized sigma subunit
MKRTAIKVMDKPTASVNGSAAPAPVTKPATTAKTSFGKTTADSAMSHSRRVEAGLPFVEALARRMAATMPHSIDLSDLVQDGVIGLIDAAHRFDDSRGIKFETFAERRIRGAMIDALRKDAWPRGVRRVRRELEAAREKLRASLGHEPSLADLAQAIGSDAQRHCDAAGARTEGDRALLLQRSDDEGHRRGARRQRVARLAAARAGDSPAA